MKTIKKWMNPNTCFSLDKNKHMCLALLKGIMFIIVLFQFNRLSDYF